MPNITPWLWFDTEAQEAAEYYTSIFPNSKITEVTHYGEAGPRPGGTVLTVTFELDGTQFTAMGCPGSPRRLEELMRDPDSEIVRRVTEAMLQMGKLEVAELEDAAAGARA